MSSSPSLDGRAVVADTGTFPAGLFAKTVGYLPGDSINVTNPSNGQNVEILVIGSLDPSEGVAVLLSPEAADCLGIKKNSNMLVKLTKRSGELDENANGSCVLTQSKAPAVTEKEPEVDEVEELNEENAVEEVAVEEVPAEEALVIEDEVEVLEETEIEAPSDIDEEQNIADEVEIAEETEEVENEIVDDVVLAEEEEIAEDEIPEEEQAPVIVDDYVVPEEEGVEEDEIPEEDKPAIVDDAVIPEEESVEEDEIPEEEKPVIVDDAVIPEEEGVEEDEIPPEEEFAEEEAEEDFDAIVLVPADENPPEPVEENVEESEEAPVEVDIEINVEAEQAVEEAIAEEPVETEAPVEKEFEAPVEVTSGTFEKGKWYIQIAVYSKQENVNEVIKKYGKKYPLFIDQKNGKNYVLIGPLSMDEYGAVLQRFKAFGYKDAFVKKIK